MSTPRRLVVVDDDAKVRLLLLRAFRQPEFETHVFATAAAALRELGDIRPHCVVGDIQVPDMDGMVLVRAVRAVPGLERVPFIAVSTVRAEARIQAALAAGADSFLLKPFPLRELLERVRALVEGYAPPPRGDAVRRVELDPAEGGSGLGRFTQVQAEGRSFVVLTEAVARPRFTVTTVITEKGVPQRKIESALSHPLAREDDRDTVRRQLDLQHDDALERLHDLVVDDTPRRVVWSDESREEARTLPGRGPVAPSPGRGRRGPWASS